MRTACGLILLAWLTAAYAAGGLGDYFASLPVGDLIATFALSLGGGVISAYAKVAKAEASGPRARKKFTADVLGSLGTGMLVYLLVVETSIGYALQGGLILVSSYSGAALLENLAPKVLDVISNLLTRKAR